MYYATQHSSNACVRNSELLAKYQSLHMMHLGYIHPVCFSLGKSAVQIPGPEWSLINRKLRNTKWKVAEL